MVHPKYCMCQSKADGAIVFCDLHEAARALLDALKDAVYALVRVSNQIDPSHEVDCDCSFHRDINRAFAAIKKAEGVE